MGGEWAEGEAEGGGGGVGGQSASLICSRKASQIDLSKTMTGLLRNINPHGFNIGLLPGILPFSQAPGRSFTFGSSTKAEKERRSPPLHGRKLSLLMKKSTCGSDDWFDWFDWFGASSRVGPLLKAWFRWADTLFGFVSEEKWL